MRRRRVRRGVVILEGRLGGAIVAFGLVGEKDVGKGCVDW